MCHIIARLIDCFACPAVTRKKCLSKMPAEGEITEPPVAEEESKWIAILGDFMPAPMGRGRRARI